jgi:formate hydrogenlyase subunit 3/multisubunit Na+/H+ antiporter MnhD subunit
MRTELASEAVALVVLAPLAGAVAAFVRPRTGRSMAFLTAGAVSAAILVLAAVVRDGPFRHPVGGWGAPLGIDLYGDGVAVALLGTTALVGTLTSIHASEYFGAQDAAGGAHSAGDRAASFWPAWLLLWAGLNALFLAGDIFNLYVTLELVALTAVSLVALGGGAAALAGAMCYLFVGVVGAICYLVGVELLYATYGTLDIAGLARVARREAATTGALALMTVGLLLKTALFPLHFWLPRAHASAPAPCSALLSALVVKASFVVLLRLWGSALAPAVTPAAAWLLGALGVGAIAWGSVMALRVERLKLLVAYSTVAQLGYLFLAVPLALAPGVGARAWVAATYFAVAHALAKAGMFLAAGSLARLTSGDRIAGLRGLGAALPVATMAFALSGVSLMGLPPTGGFVAKWLLLEAALAAGLWWWGLVIAAGGLLTAGYVFRVLRRAFDEPGARDHEVVGRLQAPRGSRATRGDWAALALAACAVVLGLAAPRVVSLLDPGSPHHGSPPAAIGVRPTSPAAH